MFNLRMPFAFLKFSNAVPRKLILFSDMSYQINHKNVFSYASEFLTTIKYIVLKSPIIILHLKGHLKLVEGLKFYKERGLISLRTYILYTSSYLSKTLHVKKKLIVLTYHYNYLKTIFKPVLLNQVFKNGVIFWRHSKSSEKFGVTLKFTHMLEFEGSLALVFNFNEVNVFTLSFSFSPGDVFGFSDATIIYIACMQGVKDEFVNYAKATKTFNENIPPLILVKVLEAFATVLDIEIILGVTTADQLSFGESSNLYNFNNNYNKFWESIGGKKLNENYYLIKCPLRQKPLSLIAAKYRRRVIEKRKLLDEIYNNCYSHLRCILSA